jgi:hypothetical protein
MTSFADPRDRGRRQPLNLQLPNTARWATELPEEVQPLRLLQQFPRIANNLARLWQDDLESRMYLDELLIDHRGGRRGFPPDVHLELWNLREYCERRSAGSL